MKRGPSGECVTEYDPSAWPEPLRAEWHAIQQRGYVVLPLSGAAARAIPNADFVVFDANKQSIERAQNRAEAHIIVNAAKHKTANITIDFLYAPDWVCARRDAARAVVERYGCLPPRRYAYRLRGGWWNINDVPLALAEPLLREVLAVLHGSDDALAESERMPMT